jgi:TonB family protein
MSSYLFKSVAPFVLTLLMGLTLGTVFNGRTSRPARENWSGDFGHHGRGRGCNMERRKFSAPTNLYNWTVFLSNPQPRYTQEAREKGVEGDVRLRATFGADGNVTNIEVVDALPGGLTEEAIKAVRAIQFIPANNNGIPVDETRDMTYTFEINGYSDRSGD